MLRLCVFSLQFKSVQNIMCVVSWIFQGFVTLLSLHKRSLYVSMYVGYV